MRDSDYTNYPGIWKDIGFDKSKNILYHVNHANGSWEELFELSGLQTANQIFLIDQESDSWEFVDQDLRIHVWDSTVSNHPRIHTCDSQRIHWSVLSSWNE